MFHVPGFIDGRARMLPEREFNRIKLRAGVLGSPVQATLSSSSASSTVVRRAAPFVPSRSETITQNKGLGLDDSIAVQRNVKLDTNSPVDRMLAKKLESINAATKELENAKMQKKNFEREISKAVLHNAGSLSVCGKCHLRAGHIPDAIVMAKNALQPCGVVSWRKIHATKFNNEGDEMRDATG